MTLSSILTKLRVVPCLQQIYRRSHIEYKMNTIYFRHQTENKKVQVNFRYVNHGLGIDRVFNFNRSENEKIDVCLERIQINVQKEFMKKFKKQKKKKQAKVDTELNTKNEEQESPPVSVKMDRNGDLVKELDLLELCPIADELKLYILEEPFVVSYNEPCIVHIALPLRILANFYAYPLHLGMQCSNPDETGFAWYKGKKATNESHDYSEDCDDDNTSWTEIGNQSIYLVQPADVGYNLKLVCTPRNGSKTGPSAECVSVGTVEAVPGVCLFEARHLYTQKRLPNDQFRVVTYNLLADLYADSDYSRSTLFPYCPPEALKIDYRKQLFMKEILGYNSDIICLQEVDSEIFDKDLKPVFRTAMYVGTFKPKGLTAEGLATFYNSEKFSLVRNDGLNIGENISTLDIFNDLWTKIRTNEQLAKRISERSTAVQVTTIKAIDTNKIVIVANTHLYFHPDADHIRLLQIAFCMKYVEFVHEQIKKELNSDGTDISIIFCGDFNSVPECGIFKLMTQRHVEENYIDFQSNAAEAVKDVSLSQPFEFKSAYAVNPKYTNFTVEFAACLDYIFYQSSNLHVIQSVPVPTDEELLSHAAIPSVVHPSDHISLCADFEWIKK